MKSSIVKIIGAADGTVTPHDGRFIIDWNPHVKAGTLEVTSTDNPGEARVFNNGAEFVEWKTISRVQPVRPWDGKPNRPLAALTIEILKREQSK